MGFVHYGLTLYLRELLQGALCCQLPSFLFLCLSPFGPQLIVYISHRTFQTASGVDSLCVCVCVSED